MRHEEILGLLPNLKYGPDHHAGVWLFLLELLFWAVVFLFTMMLLRFRPVLLERAESRLHAASQRTGLWLLTFGLTVIFLRVALLPQIPVPIPVVHDEFSYLLGADTFAHGRVTNDAGPMWAHFESFHINVQPTYQSMYPPAQGLTLALGQKLTGVPWAGVVLSTALMCSAVYWMLLAWMPPAWAWLGGAFAVVRYGVFSYWINSYWGGTVAAIGGALVLGALPRFRKNPTSWMALIFAAGLLILANSRPLEGFLFSLPLVLAGAAYIVKSCARNWRAMVNRLLPAMVLLIAGAGGMLYYNWRSTGHALVMPYAVNFKTYHISKPFLFQKPNPIPDYRHPVMRVFYVYHELPDLVNLKSMGAGYLSQLKANVYYAFFLWPFLLLVAPALYAMARDPELRIILASLGLLALDLFAQIWPPHAHYAAPAAGAIILLVLHSLRHFRETHAEFGIWASRAVVIVLALLLISPVAQRLRDPYAAIPRESPQEVRQDIPLQVQRERIKSDLEARGGRHLLIVHYPVGDVPSQDWIYNDSDIKGSQIIWARDMGYLANRELIDYYSDRRVWYVDRGDSTARLVPYDQATQQWSLALSGPSFEGPLGPARSPSQPAQPTAVPAGLRSASYSTVQQHIP
ncbi:MAG: hypothetical protein WBV31_07090 [Terriglobales bacterium]